MSCARLCAAVFVISLAASGTATAAPVPISNSSFETPDLTDSFQYMPAGATWTFTGGAGISDPPSAFGPTPALDGSQYAFLQLISSFSQSISFAASDNYVLSFMAAGRPAVFGTGGNQSYRVLLDTSVIFQDSTTTGSAFSPEQSAPFFVSAGLHTLTFEGLNTFLDGGDNTAFIDAIAINSVVTGTPAAEPTSALLLAIGLAGLAAVRRRVWP